MKALLICDNKNGYEDVTIVANRIDRNNGFHLIVDCDNKLLMGGGMLFEDTEINRRIFDSFPKDEVYKVAQGLRLEPHKISYFKELNWFTVNNNVNDDEPLTMNRDEFVQWAQMIRDENEDTLEHGISDSLDAYNYIHSYCGNWDIINLSY